MQQSIYAVDTHLQLTVQQGRVVPLGATVTPQGVNFAVASLHATACTLVLFWHGASQPFAELPFPRQYRVGGVFTMLVRNLPVDQIDYGYRLEGPSTDGHLFDPQRIILDPYARVIAGLERWGEPRDSHDIYPYRARILVDDFDWGDDHPLQIPIEDIVVYEMHIRGFTRHPSSHVQHPGTYAGMIAKIPYLRQLGINAVELMPIFEFDETHNPRSNPFTSEKLLNYWGYDTLGFFAPKASYAAQPEQSAHEFKQLVKALHSNGIEVLLDVVYNHTPEGNEQGPIISFKGIDNKTHYMLSPDGSYFNFTGTGNTMNVNHPVVQAFILDSLRYWVEEFHIDGFRFDLASILTRSETGEPMTDPPILRAIAHDPVLRKAQLIAEPWDAGGLYHVGTFPGYDRWGEWNGKYRDAARRFLRGNYNHTREMVQRMEGSPDLYPHRSPVVSVNFITAHDGFTLSDMMSYEHKHNEANGENNQDGGNDNNSHNYGVEGPTDDPAINAMRRRQIKNAAALLLMSQGVPMLLMGDEVGRSQQGNNNTYCQDNELNWFDWSLTEQNADLLRFFQACIAFRHAHPALRSSQHFRYQNYMLGCYADITWFGIDGRQPARIPVMAYLLDGKHAKCGNAVDDMIFFAINMHNRSHHFDLPPLPEPMRWRVFANTGDLRQELYTLGAEPPLDNQTSLPVRAHSVVILVGR